MDRRFFPAIYPVPLAALLVPFMAGIFCGRGAYGLTITDIAGVFSLAAVASAFFSFPLCRRSDGSIYGLPDLVKRLSFLAVLFTVLFLSGMFHWHFTKKALWQSQAILLDLAQTDQKILLRGIITGLATPASKGARVRVLVEEAGVGGKTAPVNETLIASFKSISCDELRPGRRVLFYARIYRIRNFGTPGTFDFENYWALRGIMTRASCMGPLNVVFLRGRSSRYGFMQCFSIEAARLRWAVTRVLISDIEPRDVSSVAVALVTGSRAWLSPDLKRLFSAAGLGHLFAVSGLHMAIVAAFAAFFTMFVCRFIPWILLNVDIRKISWMAAVLSCGFYCLLAGFSPSSLRAFVMISSVAFCIILGRKSRIESGLAAAAWILLLLSPFYLFDVSFQLSFLMVFFLIHIGGAIEMEVPVIKRRPVVRFLMVCLLAFVVSSPLAAFYFQRFNPWSLVLNILCIPLVEFLVLPMLFSMVFCWLVFPPMCHVFMFFASLGTALMLLVARSLTSPSWINHFVIPPTPWELSMFLGVMLMIPLSMAGRRCALFTLSLCCILISGHFLSRFARTHRDFLILHVVDVGQGLCQVLELPGGDAMVVDTGGFRESDFDVGSALVAPYLRRLGIGSIEVMAISHPDTDHVGGAVSIVREFPVKRAWLNGDDRADNKAYRKLLVELRKRGIPISRFRGYDRRFPEKGVVVDCMAPESVKGRSRNNAGLVLRLVFGKNRLLLPGDIEKRRELEMLAEGLPVSARVMVVPHHGAGSSSSTPFLKAVSPWLAACSCGYKNPFHHPARQVVERYRVLGITFLRTDRVGTVDIKIARNGAVTASGYYMDKKLSFNPGSI